MTSPRPDVSARGQLAPLDVSFSDDPRVVKEAANEDYSTHIVPLTWRSGRLSLTMTWYALVSGMFYLVTAATLAVTVGTVNTLVGILLAVVCFGTVNYFFSAYAARTGLTVALISQRVFGYVGSVLAPLVLAATAIYYAVFEGSVIAHALHAYTGALNIEMWYAISILSNVPMAIGGVRRWLDKFNGALLPLYWTGLMIVIILAVREYEPSGWLTHTPDVTPDLGAPGWLYAFFVYMGVFVFMMYTIDFGRFGAPKDARYHGVVTFGPVFYLFCYFVNGLIGIFLVLVADTVGAPTETAIGDTVVALMGVWGLGVVWLTQSRINTANYYVASTNLEATVARLFHIRVPRVAALALASVVTYLIMLTDVLSYVLTALAWQGAFVVGWVGIMLTHLIVHRGGDRGGLPEFRPGRVATIAPGAVVWLISSLTGIMLLEFTGTFGTTWSSPVTFALSVVLYLVALRVAGSPLLRRGHDPRDEVDDIWEARVRCHRCDHSYIAAEMDRDPSAEGSPAICADCAGRSRGFRRAVLAQAREAGGTRPAGGPGDPGASGTTEPATVGAP
ncbi:purine-cytosine permease family protein [Streptomyces sp. NPDC004609]|uniref:purine-cytosine permease family protein n=1 Tax=Streptomyces sp. NPDC004609 TaxID=3364704 RepID=UPI0036823A9F